MRSDSLRLRLTQGEVTALVEKGRIEESVTFGPGSILTYALVVEGAKIEASFDDGTRVVVRAPESVVHSWAKSPETVGFEATQDCGDGNDGKKTLRILVEKDFACLVDRPHEDNADAFPNPNASC